MSLIFICSFNRGISFLEVKGYDYLLTLSVNVALWLSLNLTFFPSWIKRLTETRKVKGH